MSKQGYVKLYRQIEETSIWVDSDKFKLWIYCLLKASHTDSKTIVGNQEIELSSGQFITGRNALEAEFNKGVPKEKRVSGLTLVRWLELFEKMEMLNIKRTNKYSIITVLNWNKFQNNEQQVNISCTSNEQQVNTNKNVKNDNNVKNKKEIYKEKRFTPPTFDEVNEYCKQRNNNVDAQRFIDYYTSNGWMVGRNKMKDWKATVRTWERKQTTSTERTLPDWYNKETKETFGEVSQNQLDEFERLVNQL